MSEVNLQILKRSNLLSGEKYLEPKYFYNFCQDVLLLDKLSPFTHMRMCEFVSNMDIDRKMLMVPRETFKTTIGGFARSIWIVLRHIILFDDPWVTLLLDSAGKTHTEKTLNIIEKQFQYNETIRDLYGEFFYDEGVKDNKGRKYREEYRTAYMNLWQRVVAPEQRGVREHTIDTSGLGAEITGAHFRYVVPDDWVTKRNYKTPVLRQRGVEHYIEIENVMNKDISDMLILCTPWIVGDAYSYILEKHNIDPNEFDDAKYIYEGDGLTLFRKPARWLEEGRTHFFFEEHLGQEKLDELQYKMGDIFYTQMLCTYIAEEQRRFKPANYTEMAPNMIPGNGFDRYVISVDPSGDDIERGICLDVIIGFGTFHDPAKGFCKFIDKVWAKKASSSEELLDEIINFLIYRRDAYDFVNFERVTFISWLKSLFYMKLRDEGLDEVRVVTSQVPRTKSKIERISALSYDWNNGRIIVNSELDEEIKRMIHDQFVNFPKAMYMDIPDALEMGVRKLGVEQYNRDVNKKLRPDTTFCRTNEKGELSINVEAMRDQKKQQMVRPRRIR